MPTEAISVARNTHHNWSDAERDSALIELVVAGGNHSLASKRLRLRGLYVSTPTLRRLAEGDLAERYEQIREQSLARVRRVQIAMADELALRYSNAERAAIERFEAEIGDMTGAAAAGAAKNFAVGKAINIDKSQLLRGQPTAIVKDRSGAEMVRELRKLAPHLAPAVDSTAEEIVDAEEVAA